MDSIDIADLTFFLERTNLHERSTHELQFSFPDTDLLPPGKNPHLDVPQHIAFRERPNLQLTSLESQDLEVFRIFTIKNYAPQSTAPAGQERADLMEAIQRLKRSPGQSALGVVAFAQDDEIVYRCRLHTTWKLASGDVTEVHDFQRDSLEWDMTVLLGAGHLWLRLLAHLMARRSDLAYFAVLNKLWQYDPQFATEQETKLTGLWNTQPALSANQLLGRRLVEICETEDGEVEAGPIEDIAAYADNAGDIQIRLECGHRSSIDTGFLLRLTQEEALELSCDEGYCGKRIMQKEDSWHMALIAAKKLRSAYLECEFTMWRDLDRGIPETASIPDFTSETLYEALDWALESLQPPDTVVPYMLCPASFKAMDLAIAALRTFAAPGGQQRTCTAIELARTLLGVVAEALKADNAVNMSWTAAHSRFERFVHRWIKRSVNHLVDVVEGRKPAQDVGNMDMMLAEMEKFAIDDQELVIGE